MVNIVKNFFAPEPLVHCNNDKPNSLLEMSKNQLPFNEAFLTLAHIEPERTVSASLDELDQCMINKFDLLIGDDGYDSLFFNNEDDKIVHFTDESPNVYSLTSISEISEVEPSPLNFSSSPPYRGLSLDELLSSNEMTTNESFSLKNDPIDTLLCSSYSTCNSRGMINSEVSNDSPTSDEGSILSLKNRASNDLTENYQYTDSNPDILTGTEIPKSILKKKQYEPDLLSEPIARKHSEYRTPYFRRDIKSVSHLEKYLQPTIQRQKKFSVPARLPLRTLQHTLKANKKFLNSLKQTNDCSAELIDLLIKQGERLNSDIKLVLIYNAIKYSGIAAFGLFLSFSAISYLAKLIKSK